MDQWLQFARGPLFIVCFVYMALALARLLLIQFFAIPGILKKTGEEGIETGEASSWMLEWLLPLKRALAMRPLFSLVSIVWILCLIIVPALLVDHILLWNRSIGFGPIHWPVSLTLSRHMADGLAAVAIALTGLMLFCRMVKSESKITEEPLEYFFLVLLMVPFAAGFLAAHPSINPFDYTKTMLVHVLSAEAIFILLPMTKLARDILSPIGRSITHVFWKFPEGTDEKAAVKLFGGEA